jgi:ABC-2 type transport system permease protein
LSFYLALLFSGSSFVSMGLFFSSLSRNQIVSAVLTFVAMLSIFAAGVLLVRNQEVAPLWRATFRHISYDELWNESLRGRLHLRSMILQGSFSFLWLFLTVKVLDARRWS